MYWQSFYCSEQSTTQASAGAPTSVQGHLLRPSAWPPLLPPLRDGSERPPRLDVAVLATLLS
jgi:hypothetical protein